MAYKIIWSPEAVADLTEIRSFIARDSEAYAVALMERVLGSIDRLADFPRVGQIVPELNNDSVHQLIVDRYRVIYRLGAQIVDVAAIVHGARDFPVILARRGID